MSILTIKDLEERSKSLPSYVDDILLAIESETDAVKEYDSILEIPNLPSKVQELIREIRDDEKDHMTLLSALLYQITSTGQMNNEEEVSVSDEDLELDL